MLALQQVSSRAGVPLILALAICTCCAGLPLAPSIPIPTQPARHPCVSLLASPLQCAELLDILLTAGSGAPDAPEAVPVGELPEPEEAAGCSAEAVVKALLEAGVLAIKA